MIDKEKPEEIKPPKIIEIEKILIQHIEPLKWVGENAREIYQLFNQSHLDWAKANGYVKLAEDQSLPYILPTHLAPFKGYNIQQDMLKQGWKKVAENKTGGERWKLKIQ